jgi:hypothetical protein
VPGVYAGVYRSARSAARYPSQDVASLRVRHKQLTRRDFHQLDCSLVGCSPVVRPRAASINCSDPQPRSRPRRPSRAAPVSCADLRLRPRLRRAGRPSSFRRSSHTEIADLVCQRGAKGIRKSSPRPCLRRPRRPPCALTVLARRSSRAATTPPPAQPCGSMRFKLPGHVACRTVTDGTSEKDFILESLPDRGPRFSYLGTTFVAHGPFLPCPISNSTF